MKKITVILVVLICVGMSMTAHAQENNTSSHLADDKTGMMVTPAEYWAANGYPDYVSFAFVDGGEWIDDETLQWEVKIGIVNASETDKQAILKLVADLISPNCFVTFVDCEYSYQQREAVYKEIMASRNDFILDAQMLANSEVVLVAIADGYEDEYAQKFIEQYGSFIKVVDDWRDNDVDGDISGNEGNNKNNINGFWFIPICLIFLVGASAILYNRTRFILAIQTTNGSIVTKNAPVSRKQTISAIKNSAIAPSDNVFNSIMEKIEKAQK